MFIFSWIRAKVREAFAQGAAEGLQDIAGATSQPGLTLAEVVAKLQVSHASQPAIATKQDASPEAIQDKTEEGDDVPAPIAERNVKRKKAVSS